MNHPRKTEEQKSELYHLIVVEYVHSYLEILWHPYEVEAVADVANDSDIDNERNSYHCLHEGT